MKLKLIPDDRDGGVDDGGASETLVSTAGRSCISKTNPAITTTTTITAKMTTSTTTSTTTTTTASTTTSTTTTTATTLIPILLYFYN